jgi:hypothetical protein
MIFREADGSELTLPGPGLGERAGAIVRATMDHLAGSSLPEDVEQSPQMT